MAVSIREYSASLISYGTGYAAKFTVSEESHYSNIPTLQEASEYLEEELVGLVTKLLFNPNTVCMVFPKIPDEVYDCRSMFSSCTAMTVAPALPKVNNLEEVFDDCPSLLIPAVIPTSVQYAEGTYLDCVALKNPVSIPKNVTKVSSLFEGCTNIKGELVFRPTSYPSGSYGSDFLKNTTQTITIYGDQAVCEAAAATANNGNAQWSAWYDPVPAVTNRGQGSYTTAADMTRMVRNGALAVSTYAPGRMVYQQGDIVRADEWNALVEAAQTIDPTITYSTVYTNLNKIEAAFDSAL